MSKTMKKLYLAVFASNLGMTSYGLFFGWPSPSLPILLGDDSPIPVTLSEATWITSIYIVGAAVGSLICRYIINVIGRKWTLLGTAVPGVIGWLMIAFAASSWELMCGRFICGLSNGHGYIAATIYVGEISPPEIRGILTSSLTVASKFGLFLEWSIGPFLTIRDLALLSSILPILFFATLLPFPESPYHLIRRGKRHEAISSLVQLRGTADVFEEVDIIEKSVKNDLAHDTGLREILIVPGNRRALTVVLGLLTVQQWSGSMAVLSYAELIFNATNSNLQGKYVTMILGGVQVIFAIISAAVGDHYRRRSLLIFSSFFASVSTFLVGLFFFLQGRRIDVSQITWLPAFGSILYIIVYAFGLAALPFTMMSELFPTNVKALGSTIGMVCCNLCAFVVTLSYQSIVTKYGTHSAFWLFSLITLFGIVFVYYYVPETKGRTLQEIQEDLHR